MPGVTRYISRTEQGRDATALEDLYQREWSQRQAAIREAWKLYKGEHHKHLRDDGSGTDDNVIVNLYALAVDQSVSALVGTNDQGEIEGVEFDIIDRPGEPGYTGQGVPDEDASQPSAAQLYLERAWNKKTKNILLHDALMNASVTGHAFLKIVPEGRRERGESLPRVINLNPAIVTVFWDDADVETVLWYRIEYGPERSKRCQDIVRTPAAPEPGPAQEVTWTIYEYAQQAEQAGWQMPLPPVVWDYDWPPVVDWKNLPMPNTYYGRPDIGSGAQLNDAINFLMSNMQRIIKHHAHPKTIIIGASASQIESTAVDRLWAISNENAKVLNLEMQSDLSSSMELVRLYRSFFFDGGREVDPPSVRERLGDLTNFALRVLYNNALAKGGTKRLLAEAALEDVGRHLLDVGQFSSDVEIATTWPDGLPVNEEEQSRALDTDRKHGLSRQTYLEKRGYDAAQELARVEEERGQRLEESLVQGQANITTAIQMMGRPPAIPAVPEVPRATV